MRAQDADVVAFAGRQARLQAEHRADEEQEGAGGVGFQAAGAPDVVGAVVGGQVGGDGAQVALPGSRRGSAASRARTTSAACNTRVPAW